MPLYKRKVWLWGLLFFMVRNVITFTSHKSQGSQTSRVNSTTRSLIKWCRRRDVYDIHWWREYLDSHFFQLCGQFTSGPQLWSLSSLCCTSLWGVQVILSNTKFYSVWMIIQSLYYDCFTYMYHVFTIITMLDCTSVCTAIVGRGWVEIGVHNMADVCSRVAPGGAVPCKLLKIQDPDGPELKSGKNLGKIQMAGFVEHGQT